MRRRDMSLPAWRPLDYGVGKKLEPADAVKAPQGVGDQWPDSRYRCVGTLRDGVLAGVPRVAQPAIEMIDGIAVEGSVQTV